MRTRLKMSLFNHSERLWHLYRPAISSTWDRLPFHAMAKRRPSPEFQDQLRRQLTRCWLRECDIDPLILRTRQLRKQGLWQQACWLEQELHPLF